MSAEHNWDEPTYKKVSKKKFVRDMMRMQDERKFDREEAEAKAMIEQPCGYYSEKTYSHGKKYTKQAYQC